MISWLFGKKNQSLDQDYSEIYKDVVLTKLKLFEERLVRLQDENEELHRENLLLEDKMSRITKEQKHINDKLRIIKRRMSECIVLEPYNSPRLISRKPPTHL